MVFGTTLLSLTVPPSTQESRGGGTYLYSPYKGVPPPPPGPGIEVDAGRNVMKPDKMLEIRLIPMCKNKWIKDMRLKVG